MKNLLTVCFTVFVLSQNAFTQWVLVDPPATSFTLNSVDFISQNVGWAVGEVGQILKTTNGGITWNSQTSNTLSELKSVCFMDENTGTVVGANGTILRTTNGGMSWHFQVSGTTNQLFSVSFIDENTGTVVGYYTGPSVILKTTNGGLNWTPQSSGSPDIWLRHVSIPDINTGIILGANMPSYSPTILRTTNAGTTWTSQSTPYNLSDICFTDANTATAVGNVIVRTSNGGVTWIVQLSGTDLNGVSFTDVNNGTAVGALGTILRTTNGGTTWTSQMSPTNKSLRDVDFVDANTGFAVGLYGTIIRTTNSGVPVELTSFNAVVEGNWITLIWSTGTELNNRGFEIERKNNSSWRTLGFISGHGTTSEINNYSYTDNLSDLEGSSSVYYRLKQLDYDGSFEYSKEIEVSFAADYSLGQNYPNPYNPSTIISYSIPLQCKISLIVFDALGREVRKLVDEEKDAGKYEIEFNAEGLTSGVYFYRLHAGSFFETKKMILMQ